MPIWGIRYCQLNKEIIGECSGTWCREFGFNNPSIAFLFPYQKSQQLLEASDSYKKDDNIILWKPQKSDSENSRINIIYRRGHPVKSSLITEFVFISQVLKICICWHKLNGLRSTISSVCVIKSPITFPNNTNSRIFPFDLIKK